MGAGLIGSERDGGFAEYVAVPAENAHAVESPLGDEELATFPTAHYVTAERMLKRARLEGGETFLVTGAVGARRLPGLDVNNLLKRCRRP